MLGRVVMGRDKSHKAASAHRKEMCERGIDSARGRLQRKGEIEKTPG